MAPGFIINCPLQYPLHTYSMQSASLLALAVVLLAIHQATAQLSTKESREACMAQMMAAQQAETDKDLSDKLTKAHVQIKGTVDMVQALSDAQKDKLRSTYFVGVCAPIKDFYNL